MAFSICNIDSVKAEILLRMLKGASCEFICLSNQCYEIDFECNFVTKPFILHNFLNIYLDIGARGLNMK